MANYYASWRSNYFLVKDEAAFMAWAKRLPVEVVAYLSDVGKQFALLPKDDEDSGGIPDSREVGEGLPPLSTAPEDVEDVEAALDEEREEIDFEMELSQHLQEGWVAVLIQTGREKLRYITGYAVAINSKGEKKSINLDGIYKLAEELGPHVTKAEY